MKRYLTYQDKLKNISKITKYNRETISSETDGLVKYSNPTSDELRNMQVLVAMAKKDEIAMISSLSKESHIISRNIQSDFKKNTVLENEYSKIKNFTMSMADMATFPSNKKMQSGNELIKDVIEFDKKIQYRYLPSKNQSSISRVLSSYEYFQDAMDLGNQALVYDLETLGGKNKSGAKMFDAITEFGYTMIDNGTTFEESQKNMNKFLVGIDEKTYRKYSKMLENGQFNYTDEYSTVVANRLALYGHEDTVIDKTAGTWKISKMGEYGKNYMPTEEEIKRGLDVLKEAYEADVKTLDATTGLTQSQASRLEMLKIMKSTDMPIVGYNSSRSDVIWNELDFYNLPENVQAIYRKELGLKPNESFFQTSPNRQFDVFKLLRTAQQGSSISNVYMGNTNLAQGHSALSQETLARTLFPDIMASQTAHGVGSDVGILSQIANHEKLLSNAYEIVKNMDEKAAGHDIKLDFGNQLFLATQSNSNAGSPLDFLIEPNGQIRLKSGYTISKDGVMTGDHAAQRMFHKNSLYTFEGAGIVKTTEEARKAINAINSDYALDSLFYIDLKGYAGTSSNKTGNLDSMSTRRIFFNKQEELETFVQDFMLIGERNGKTGEFGALDEDKYADYLAKINEQLKVIDLTNANSSEIPTFETIVENALNSEMTDRAEHAIRTNDYKKMKDMRTIATVIQNDKSMAGGSATPTGLVAKMQNDDLYFAVKVSKGEAITLQDVNYEKILNAIGFEDVGQKRVYNQTVDKVIGLSEYYYNNNAIIDNVLDTVEKMGLKNKMEKQNAYEYLMHSISNTIATDYKELNQTRAPLKLAKKDMNYVEINEDIFSANKNIKKVVSNEAQILEDNLIRISTDRPNSHYDLINTLIKNKYGEIPIREADKTAQGFSVLEIFKKEMSRNPVFKEGMKQIKDFSEYSSPEVMASDILEQINKVKEFAPTAGIIKKYTTSSINNISQNGNEVVEKLGGEKWLKQVIDNAVNQIPKRTTLTDKNIDKIAGQVTSALYETPILSGGKALKYAKQQGLVGDQAKYWANLYQQSVSDYREIITDMVKELTNIDGVTFEYNQKTKRMFIRQGGKALDITQQMPKFKVSGPLMSLELGKMNLNLHGVITGNNSRLDASAIGLETNLLRAYKEGKFNFRKVAKDSNKKGNTLNNVSAALTQFGNTLRSVSNIDGENIQKQISNNLIDVSYVYRAAVLLDMEGQLENIPGIKKDLIDAVRKFRGDKSINELDFSNLSATYVENIHQNLQPIMNKLTKDKRSIDDMLDTAVKVMTPQAGEKSVSRGFMGTGVSNVPYGEYAKGSRITQFQNNFYRFFKVKGTLEAAKAFSGVSTDYAQSKDILDRMGIAVGSKINSPYTYNLDNFKSVDRAVSYQITTNKVIVSDNNFHKIVQDHVYSKKNSSSSDIGDEKMEKLLRKIQGISLYEDETLANPRLFDSFFSNQSYTIIDDEKISLAMKKGNRKRFKELSKTLYKVEADENGTFKVKYGKGIKKKNSEILFDVKGYKDSSDVKLASYDGTLKYGFMDKATNVILQEKEINEAVSKAKSREEVSKILNQYKSTFYFERDNDERYRKIMTSNVEKSKASQLVFNIGEYDTNLKDELTEILGKNNKLLNKDTTKKDIDMILEQVKTKLSTSKSAEEVNTIVGSLENKIYKERYAAWDFIQGAFTEQSKIKEAIGLFSNENSVKHEGIAQIMNENIADLIGIQKSHYGLNDREAAEKVISQLSGIIPGFAEGKYSIDENGSIITDTIPDINNKFNILKLKQLKESGEYAEFFGEGSLLGRKMVEDEQGRAIAVVTKTTLSETEEYNIPGANMPIEYVKSVQDYNSELQLKKEQIKKIKQEITDFEQTYAELPPEQKEEIDKAISKKKRQIRGIEKDIEATNRDLSAYKKAYREQFKGMSVGEREFLAFNNYKYDKEELNILRERLKSKFGDDELFNKYFEDVLDVNGEISTKVQGKSMFANYLKGIKKEAMEQTDYDELLSANNYKQVIEEAFGNKDEHIKNGIKNIFEKGLEKGEFEQVSMETLESAYFLNQSTRANQFNTLKVQSEGSIQKMLDNGFEKIHIDDMQFAMEDDIDIVEKLGKSIYSKNLLVDIGDGNLVAAPYMPHTQYKGSVVQKDYQSDFKMVAKSRQEMAEALKSGDVEAYDKAHKNYAQYTGALKQNIRDNTLGKDGVLKDKFKIRLEQSFRAKTSTAYNNYEGFDKAMFDGKTIREWTEDGVYLDVAFGNQKMFENMGVLNKKHLDSLKGVDFTINGEVVSKSGDKVTKEMMLEKLEVDGIDAITTRYPTNMQGSLTPGKLYLDRTIDPSQNKVKLAYWTQLAKNGDNDGDDLFGAIMKYYDPKTNTYTNSLRGAKREGTDAAMMLRANTTNVYYAEMAKQKQYAKTAIDDNFSDFIRKKTIGGEKTPEYFGNIFSDYTQEQIDTHLNVLEDLEAKMGSKIDISNYSNVNTFLDTVSDDTQKNIYKSALAFRDSTENQVISMVAKTRKKSIGEVDNLSYLLRREAAELAGNKNITQKELQSVNAVSFLVTQGIISSKNYADIENPNIVEDYRSIINKAHYGKIDKDEVNKFLDEQVKPNFKSGESVALSAKYANELEINQVALEETGANAEEIAALQKEFSQTLDEQNYETAKNDFHKFLKELNNDEMRKFKHSTDIGTKVSISENAVTKGANGLSSNVITNKDTIMNLAMSMENSVFHTVDPKALSTAGNAIENSKIDMDKVISEMQEYALKKTNAQEMLANAKPKNLAGIAIGLATAYMITGFVGGNPSTPATTQAHKVAEEDYEPQYTLSDYGSNYQYNSTNKGYVINIKSKGNDRETQNAINNISQSISSSINSNVNVNLRIQEMFEIDNRKINRLVKDALNL